MYKRIACTLLALALILLPGATASAGGDTVIFEAAYGNSVPVRAELTNIKSSEQRVVDGDELLSYAYDPETLGVVVDPDSGSTYRDFANQNNMLDGLTVYYADNAPVDITVLHATSGWHVLGPGEVKVSPKYVEWYSYFDAPDEAEVLDTAPEYWLFGPGTSLSITEPGKYLVFFGSDMLSPGIFGNMFALHIAGDAEESEVETEPEVTVEPEVPEEEDLPETPVEPAETTPVTGSVGSLKTTEGLVNVLPPAPVEGQDLAYTVQKGEQYFTIAFNY